MNPILNTARPASRPRRRLLGAALINANAIVGIVAKDSNGDRRIDIMRATRADGTVSQAGAPLNLPVPASARSIGLVVS